MEQNLLGLLGTEVSKILGSPPFLEWKIERSVEEDLDERIIHYVFPENGVEFRCDNNEKVCVIFLFSEKFSLLGCIFYDVFFSWNRGQVIKYFGNPEKCSSGTNHPILGKSGPWDRFIVSGGALRFEYSDDNSHVKKITIMRQDVIP